MCRKVRVGTRQGEADRLVVDDLDALQAVGLAGGYLVEALDAVEEAGAGALGLRADDPVEGILHVLGGHLAAVVELHPLTQGKGIGQAVLADLIVFARSGTSSVVPGA
jgi:GNAT superfamily N-acetyltransferase